MGERPVVLSVNQKKSMPTLEASGLLVNEAIISFVISKRYTHNNKTNSLMI